MPVTQFCWRCQMDVPMLTDSERDIAWEALTCKTVPIRERRAKLLAEYERITGFRETNPNAVMHHVVSQHGPPCQSCGKPLRTPQASFCAACGTKRIILVSQQRRLPKKSSGAFLNKRQCLKGVGR